jgi:hypothetical protein
MQLERLGKQHGSSQKILLNMAADAFAQNIMVLIMATGGIFLQRRVDLP